MATREERGRMIASLEGAISRVDDALYEVKSQSGHGDYDVFQGKEGWACSCPDYEFRQAKCKHIWAVEFSVAFREKVRSNLVIEPLSGLLCRFCSSEQIVRDAKRHNKFGIIQRYLCRTCHKRFSFNEGFEKMKASPQAITGAMQLYFTGESFRNVQRFLKLQGVAVSHVAVYKWIGKYTRLMERYLEQMKPQVSDTWRADELYLKVKGNMKYLFAMMDDETRFWIAQEVADSKFTHDARKLFRLSQEVAGKRPATLITDGLHAYHEAYRKEYWTNTVPRTQHVRHITVQGDRNNNKMERLNGEIRDREKVFRGLKNPDSPILPGYQIYHNYLRPHEALDGKTPAEACGIQVQGENKWLTLIQNASHHPTVNSPSRRPQS